MAARIEAFGTPAAYNHYAVGWAHAMCTPYQWTKQVASHWGGTRNGTIVHWPAGIEARGELRRAVPPCHRCRPHHPRGRGPARAHLRQRRPAGALRGRQHGRDVRRRPRPRSATRPSTSRCSSTAASTTRAGRPSHATARPGWWSRCLPTMTTAGSSTARTTGRRRVTWPPSSLSGSHHLQRLFLIEAARHNVLPLDDRRVERFNADLAGRPQLIHGRTQLLFGGMGRLTENSVLVPQEQVPRRDRRGRRVERGRSRGSSWPRAGRSADGASMRTTAH